MPDALPDTLAPVGALLRTHADRFRDLVQNQLYAAELASRQIFPMRASASHRELAVSVAWALERSDSSGAVSQEALVRMRQLGMSHRRHGFPTELYQRFNDMLLTGLRTLASEDASFDSRLLAPAERAVTSICFAMQASAHTADLSGIPAVSVGEVTEVIRHSQRRSTVHLECGTPLSYQPGQYLPVTTNYLPGIWRNLTPAYPVNDYGTVEFHIQSVDGGSASPLLATARVGDLWSIGAARGDFTLPTDAPAVLIAYGAGAAAAKALILDRAGHDDTPPVHLVLAAEYPGELTGVDFFDAFAADVDWLTVTPVSQSATNAWWPTERSLQRSPIIAATTGELLDAAVTPEDLTAAEFLITGPADAVDETVVELSARETPWPRIHIQRFDAAELWPRPLL